MMTATGSLPSETVDTPGPRGSSAASGLGESACCIVGKQDCLNCPLSILCEGGKTFLFPVAEGGGYNIGPKPDGVEVMRYQFSCGSTVEVGRSFLGDSWSPQALGCAIGFHVKRAPVWPPLLPQPTPSTLDAQELGRAAVAGSIAAANEAASQKEKAEADKKKKDEDEKRKKEEDVAKHVDFASRNTLPPVPTVSRGPAHAIDVSGSRGNNHRSVGALQALAPGITPDQAARAWMLANIKKDAAADMMLREDQKGSLVTWAEEIMTMAALKETAAFAINEKIVAYMQTLSGWQLGASLQDYSVTPETRKAIQTSLRERVVEDLRKPPRPEGLVLSMQYVQVTIREFALKRKTVADQKIPELFGAKKARADDAGVAALHKDEGGSKGKLIFQKRRGRGGGGRRGSTS